MDARIKTHPSIGERASASGAVAVRCHIIVPAAGNGFRYGGTKPKQYLPLLGKAVLQHALDRLTTPFPRRWCTSSWRATIIGSTRPSLPRMTSGYCVAEAQRDRNRFATR